MLEGYVIFRERYVGDTGITVDVFVDGSETSNGHITLTLSQWNFLRKFDEMESHAISAQTADEFAENFGEPIEA